jgi:photoactive yellow protein
MSQLFPSQQNTQQMQSIEDFTAAELDALPFGAIQLDRDGTILQFNEYEANLSNRRAPDAIGRHFFRDVAPCTDVREFHGRFKEGVIAGRLQATFDYRFEFKPLARDVRVTLYYSGTTDTVWVFIQER